MKKLIFGFIFLFLSTSIAYAGVYQNIAHKLSLKLHVVRGAVIGIKVQKKEVVLNKGYKEGLYKHSIVYIYRNKGMLKMFNDNKAVPLKEGVAYAYVSKLFPDKAIATISEGVEKERNYLIGLGIIPWGEKEVIGTPEVGDHFIAGKKTYRIAIITRSPIIYSSLKSALENTGRFYVISPDSLAIAITENKINFLSKKTSIKKLASAVDADLVMLVSTREYKTIKCKIYNGYAGNVMLSLNESVDKKSYEVLTNNKNSTTIPAKNMVASNLRLSPRLTLWEKLLDKVGLYSPYSSLDMSSSLYKITLYRSIGYGTTAFYMSDVNGNGQKDILIAKGSRVDIYGFDMNTFIKKASFSYGYNIFNIDSAKVDGRILVAISNFNRYGALDSAIGYIDKNYKLHIIKKGLPYHVRFYNKFSDNPEIIVQKAGIYKPFRGPIYVMNIESGSIRKLNLPVQPEDFYTFAKIYGYIAYLSLSGQLCLYDTDSGKIVERTAYAFGGGERPIERYHFEPNAKQSFQDVESQNNEYIAKGVVFFKENGKIYALGARNYVSKVLAINKSHYGAYSLKLLKYNAGKFTLDWSSGDVKGRIVGFGKTGNYIISVVGLPAGFFDRFIRGILEVDRLSAGQIER